MKYPQRTFRRLRDAWHSRVWAEIAERIERCGCVGGDVADPVIISALTQELEQIDNAVDRIDDMDPEHPRYSRRVGGLKSRIDNLSAATAAMLDGVNHRLLLN